MLQERGVGHYLERLTRCSFRIPFISTKMVVIAEPSDVRNGPGSERAVGALAHLVISLTKTLVYSHHGRMQGVRQAESLCDRLAD